MKLKEAKNIDDGIFASLQEDTKVSKPKKEEIGNIFIFSTSPIMYLFYFI